MSFLQQAEIAGELETEKKKLLKPFPNIIFSEHFRGPHSVTYPELIDVLHHKETMKNCLSDQTWLPSFT